ncbi:MAG: patatin-like phospholipase family protein [Pseudomonadota bacterium]
MQWVGIKKGFWVFLVASLSLGMASVHAQEAKVSPGVVVVLAGGGAKGFAHLAVLRRLEKDRVPIARIVGTSMGAVIGGLYASGMSTEAIEQVIGNLDPAKVALDQIDRLDLPTRTRAYQLQYPINLEFGIQQDGGLSFARGASDGQRFMALLQQLLAHVPAQVDFDQLRIPFRAVATRYRDGELQVFDKGSLITAIRASMAAPGVFAPVDLDGETYVDGGLVANLPVEVALREGADTVVASYLGQDQSSQAVPVAGNALTVANQMLEILIRQNEKRNLALLRPQDILVQPDLQGVRFADFNQAAHIVAKGELALDKVQGHWTRMLQSVVPSSDSGRNRLAFDQREIHVHEIQVSGNKEVPASHVQREMSALLGKPFQPKEVADLIDKLYTSGYFEQVSYSLAQMHGDQYVLNVHVREKPYGPHFIKSSLGFSTEQGGVHQFSFGVGYRRPWLTEEGLELLIDARFGTQSELTGRLFQPLSAHWGIETSLGYRRNTIPVYTPEILGAQQANQKFGYLNEGRSELAVSLNHEFDRKSVLKLGLAHAILADTVDVTRSIFLPEQGRLVQLEDSRVRYSAARLQFEVDQLDSVSFPSKGYSFMTSLEQGFTGADYRSARLSARWAKAFAPHVFNFGVNLGREDVPKNCSQCESPGNLYMGGFQFMGAYRMGQLAGERLAHAYGTYMYRLSDGGLLQQKSYLGTVAEIGRAWRAGDNSQAKRSLSVFWAVDSKIGDIYLGAARGSEGANNVFMQLGRRFNF